MDDEVDAEGMVRAGCARRAPQRLQTGAGYARGGRVAMDRVEGKATMAQLQPQTWPARPRRDRAPPEG